jgi:hypothetical protein
MLVKTRKQEKIVCPSHEKKIHTTHNKKKIKIKDVKLISLSKLCFLLLEKLEKKSNSRKIK